MNTITFDPIVFLNLRGLDRAEQKKILPKLWQHMAYYLLVRFLEELPEDEYLEVEARAKEVKNPQEVFDLVALYEPNFEIKRREWLEEYRRGFDISLVEEK